MEKVKVSFSGIDRSIDDGLAADGSCMELINARLKNGSVEPAGEPILIQELPPNIDKLYYHPLAHHILAIQTSGGVISYNEDYTVDEYLSSDLSQVERIELMGNMVICFRREDILYLMWDGEHYRYLGPLPELPQVEIALEYKDVLQETNDLYPYTDYRKCTETEFRASAMYNTVGHIDKAIARLNEEGHFFGDLFVCWAYRLYDGSHARISPVLHLRSDYESQSSMPLFDCKMSQAYELTFMSKESGSSSAINVDAFGVKPLIRADMSGLSAWEGLIMGIDFYAATLQKWTKQEEELAGRGFKYTTYRRSISSDADADKAFRDLTAFYRFAEVNLDGEEVFRLEDVSKDNLAVQETLDFTNSNDGCLAATVSYVYNNRLHLAGITQRCPDPDASPCDYGCTGLGQDVEVAVEVNSPYGTSVPKHTAYLHDTLHSFFTYPDTGARRIMFTPVQAIGSSSPYKHRVFELKAHPFLPLSYLMRGSVVSKATYKPKGETNWVVENCYLIGGHDFSPSGGTDSPLPDVGNPMRERPDVMKVSASGGVLSFPAAQTYRVGTGRIVGMCSNTVGMSQGQFGQHPLYVFTDDGIYSMSVDASGRLAYATQVPVSRDVCINRSSICGTDRSVVFATRRGLMSIAGTQVSLLSAQLDGWLPSCIDSTPLFAKIAAVAGLEGSLSDTEFRDFLESAAVGYEYACNELWVSLLGKTYSYVLSLDSGEWHKRSCCIWQFTNHAPELYAVMVKYKETGPPNVGVYALHNPHRTVARMLLLTRPVKLGTSGHKRILQTALRGVVRRALSDLYFRGEPILFRGEEIDLFSDVGLYILGSNDAEHFDLLSGKEAITDLRDLVTKMNKTRAYKYLAVALAGGVRTDVSLNYMEFMADTAFANRLR